MQHGYHYTMHKFLPSIMSKGLLPSESKMAKHAYLGDCCHVAWGHRRFSWLFDEPCYEPLDEIGQVMFSLTNHLLPDDRDFKVVELAVEYDSSQTLDNSYAKASSSMSRVFVHHSGDFGTDRAVQPPTKYHVQKEATIIGHVVPPESLTVTRMWDMVVPVPVPIVDEPYKVNLFGKKVKINA